MKRFLIMSLIFTFFSSTAKSQEFIPSKAEDINPILIGEKIPKASLLDENGIAVPLYSQIKKKATVLIIYRGGWCPYCNAQLSNLYDIEDQVVKLGFQLIAVSPESYENLKIPDTYGKINYQLYSDQDGQFSKDLGIAFKTSNKLKGYMKLKSSLGTPSEILPVPSVFIVDKQGTVLFEYINPNYKQRISSEMLLAVLKSIEK